MNGVYHIVITSYGECSFPFHEINGFLKVPEVRAEQNRNAVGGRLQYVMDPFSKTATDICKLPVLIE